MAKVKWKWNVQAFAELRSHPTLVGAMRSGAEAAASGTPFDVKVETWPHRGRAAGPRTSVQIWASSLAARRAVDAQPGELVATLNRVRV